MNTIAQDLGKHLYQVYFGGNWTDSNIKDSLSTVGFTQAITKVKDCNTILALTYHIHYFVKVAIPVFEGKPLDAHDKYSYDHPEITSEEEWRAFVDEVLSAGQKLSALIGARTDEELYAPFHDEKYGSYFKNMWGTIEHCHYHLGQINVLKKLL